MTLFRDSIDVGASEEERYRHLRRIIENVLEDTDPGADLAQRRRWLTWILLYIMWHEGDGATARTQHGGGPGRGLMQFEPRTVWNLIHYYVLGPTPGLIANLAAAAGVSPAEMEEALRRFDASSEGPGNVWPNPAPGDPARKIERWLLDIDSFGIKLMRLYFRAEGAGHSFPPAHSADRTADPQDDRFKTEHSGHWGRWWKRTFVDDAQEREQRGAFEERARHLDDVAAGVPQPPAPPPPGPTTPSPTPAPPTATPTPPPTTPPPPPNSCPFVHAFGALSAEVALGRELRSVIVSRWSGWLVVGTYHAIRPLISRVISASPKALSAWRVLAGGGIETLRLTLRK